MGVSCSCFVNSNSGVEGGGQQRSSRGMIICFSGPAPGSPPTSSFVSRTTFLNCHNPTRGTAFAFHLNELFLTWNKTSDWSSGLIEHMFASISKLFGLFGKRLH